MKAEDELSIKEKAKNFFDSSLEVVSAGGGAMISTIFGIDPITGAMIGNAASSAMKSVLKKGLTDTIFRETSKQEKRKISITVFAAYEKIQNNLKQNIPIRDDDFFTRKPNDRSTAEEIFEGVVFAAQRDHEEKKLKFLGNLFGNLAFYSDIDRAQANLLLKTAQRCSYRQLCILSLFREKNLNLRKEKYENEPGKIIRGAKRIAVLTEILELCLQGLIGRQNIMVNYLGNIAPAEMDLRGHGSTLFELMELGTIEQSDIEGISELLK